jgi:hypothetical protein
LANLLLAILGDDLEDGFIVVVVVSFGETSSFLVDGDPAFFSDFLLSNKGGDIVVMVEVGVTLDDDDDDEALGVFSTVLEGGVDGTLDTILEWDLVGVETAGEIGPLLPLSLETVELLLLLLLLFGSFDSDFELWMEPRVVNFDLRGAGLSLLSMNMMPFGLFSHMMIGWPPLI